MAEKPEWMEENLWDGSFFTEPDTYLCDHVIGRDQLIELDTRLDLMLGRPVVHQVAVLDRRLMPFHGYTIWDLDYLAERADQMAGQLAEVQS